MNKEARVFIDIYVSYFGAALDKTTEGKCTLDIPVQSHYSHLSSNKPAS